MLGEMLDLGKWWQTEGIWYTRIKLADGGKWVESGKWVDGGDG